MTTPKPLPLRVLVKGASTVNWTSWMGGPRQDFAFPRVIEDSLIEQGRACDLRVHTMPSEQTKTILGTWQREVLGFSPDAIVLLYGHYETIHLFLPRWLERHANSLRGRPRPVARFYRRAVVRPVWKTLAQLQAAVDRKWPATSRRRRLERVAADLDAYIDQVSKVGSPIVYLFELLPPNERFASWFPGMADRIALMNEIIAELVARHDSDRVRLVQVSDLVKEHAGGDLAVAIPDGFHYSPELHRAIGERIAADIDAWADTQSHLTHTDRP